jgi:hypothetical protein
LIINLDFGVFSTPRMVCDVRRAARQLRVLAVSGSGREMLVEMVDNQAKPVIHNANSRVGRPFGADRVRVDLHDELHGTCLRRFLAGHSVRIRTIC